MHSLKNTYLLIISLAVFAIVVGYIRYQGHQRLNNPTNYDECTVAPGAVIQESYPEVCKAPNGSSFTRPLSPEEEARLNPPTPTPSPTPVPWPTFSTQDIQLEYPLGWTIASQTSSRTTLTASPTATNAATLVIAKNSQSPVPATISKDCTQELGSEPFTLADTSTHTLSIYLVGEPDGLEDCLATGEQIVRFQTSSVSDDNIQVSLSYFEGEDVTEYQINRIFESIELAPNPTPTPIAAQRSECIITGCSGQICASEEVSSTCEYLEEYACYKSATCELQSDGRCGWTPSPELTTCLQQFVPANL